MNRYICIHGHFYQPPRENPWLEEVELQDSAHPYHDWNERITSECYAPNAASRILGPDKKVSRMVNNYASMSFNFGPTLLSWMERHAPEDYQNILAADKESQTRFSGHGSAIAQVYNHMIMPLANVRDERTQVLWGIRDFEHRFGRKPEGMWLAETAVNTRTLEILAEHGIGFTILAPHQAARVRKIGEEKWTPVKDAGVDPQMAYVCPLPSGKKIHLFFYDGPIAREVAFADLLESGVNFANRLLGVFPRDQHHPRLVHVATDGETYGHHHSFGDMALSYCLHHIASQNLARVTIYGEYLERFPAAHEVQIVENTSWSCAHGVERWRSDCGCKIGGHRGWHQKWRAPLRQSLDWLRDTLAPLYEGHMSAFSGDPWQARDNYIEVVLDRGTDNVENFLRENFRQKLSAGEEVKVLKLLELQRYAMLMYTSCGWFFDEISGIEGVQILQYAGRALQLARELFGKDFEGHFKKMLEAAPSNIADLRNGAAAYEKFVAPAVTDLTGVGAHYAVSAMFDDHTGGKKVYCYTVREEIYDLKQEDGRTFVIGRLHVRSDITREEGSVDFAVVPRDGHHLNAAVRVSMSEEDFRGVHQEMERAFAKGDVKEIDRLTERHFGATQYALKYLFRDEQKRIFDEVIHSAMEEFEDHFREIYEHYYPLLQAKEELHIALPKALIACIEFILNRDLLDLFAREQTDISALKRIAVEVKRWAFEIDKTRISFVATRRIISLMRGLEKDPRDMRLMESVDDILRAVAPLNLDLDLWRAQRLYLAIARQVSGGSLPTPEPRWLNFFHKLGDHLNVQSEQGEHSGRSV
ncbi:MAG TPA: glycoside hydrolase [Candidatus Omnitrophica bacterium]|nr:MAG: glycoside hydrolase [Omnitrophica WOR_2 bacterium GWA2_53_43]HCI44579.1 glycoside hydrolase [Candidatus Omnitrophota bacterium]